VRAETFFNQRNELVFVSFADKDAKKYFPGQLNSFFSLGAHGKKPALFGDEAIDDWFLEICWCFESLGYIPRGLPRVRLSGGSRNPCAWEQARSGR
jgi:hypothetical protein